MEKAKRVFELHVKRMVESYVHCHGMASHQVESYEHFVHFMLPDIIMENSPITIHNEKYNVIHRIFLSNMCIKKPTIQEANGFIRELRPSEAHLRKQTYSFDVFLDVEHKVYKTTNQTGSSYKLNEHKIYQNVLFCKIPCMVNSSTCHTYKDFNYPQRSTGIFLINGYEKCIITQEKMRCNFPYVFPIKRATKYTYRCEIRSFHSSKIRSTSTLNIYISAEKTTSVPEISLIVPFIKHYIPLPVIFRLLDVCDLKSMMYYIVDTAPNCSQKLRYRTQSILCNDTSNTVNMSTDELYDWIGLKGSTEKQKKKRIQYIKHIFLNEFLPHCGNDYSTEEKTAETNSHKAFYLGYCVRKLLMVSTGVIPPDDIDHYANKRCCSTGLQFALLVRQLIRSFIQMLRIQVYKAINNNKYINIVDFFNHRRISTGIRYACATGNWGIQRGKTNQSGVCQVINSMNLSARLSHIRLVNTPINRDGKLPRPRQLHRSHLGILCAPETPEGKSVGLLNQLAFLTRIRIGYPSRFIIDLLVSDMEVIRMPINRKIRNLTLVLVNGIICGGVKDPAKLVTTYKKYRQWYSAPIDSSIIYRENHKEVSILTDAEDCYRPLIRTDKLKDLARIYGLYCEYLHLLWSQLLIEGIIEYVNKEEESGLFTCMLLEDITPQHTHLELHPSFTLFGVSAGLIVFANHNQAPRNIYQCLHVDEPVQMGDGSRKAIRDVNVGDDVITFDPDTLKTSVTKVVQQIVTKTDKTVVEITTTSGRKITVTDDHKFMTNQGWKCAQNFDQDTLLGVNTSTKYMPNIIPEEVVVLTRYCLFMATKGVKSSLVAKHALDLEKMKLLPFVISTEDIRVPVLARMMGYIMAQGSCHITSRGHTQICVDFGYPGAATRFSEDVCTLGFVSGSPSLATFFWAIGLDKAHSFLPSWIVNGSKKTKQQFLAGFQRCRIRWKEIGPVGYNLITAAAFTTVVPEHAKSMQFQLRQLYLEFGINCKVVCGTQRCYDKIQVGVKLQDHHDNLIHYFDTIGHGYDTRQLKVVEYLRFIIGNPLETKQPLEFISKLRVQNGMLFLPIKSIQRSKECMVADITTESTNHSFVGGRGGFLVHNSAMGKQAISGQPLGFESMMDTKTHVLDYPQRPAVTTWTSGLVGYDDEPAGQACVVAIMCYTGFNQEDSVILNQSALDRGLFQSTFYRTSKESEVTHGSDVERFDSEHNDVLGKRKANYDKLDSTGIVPIATKINKDDVIIGKTIEYTVVNKCPDGSEYTSKRVKRDRSIVSKNDEEATVHSVIFSDTKEGLKFVSVKTASTRIPEIGDKLSSRHGQKGIIGMTYNHADMPFTTDGIVPDIIVNCHAIPSRMTVAQLLETHLGKVSCIEGKIADGTSFRKISAEQINERTLDDFGKEIMYNGMTGQKLKEKVFIGIAYYQRYSSSSSYCYCSSPSSSYCFNCRLRHMVQDKLHARARGPNQILTRQPVEGRSRKGGFRMGEMERDALICHGASAVITDRFLDQSDKYRTFVCQMCGYLAEPGAPDKIKIVNILHKTPYCRFCKSNDNIHPVVIPYAFKLLTQELAAVHIGLKFNLNV